MSLPFSVLICLLVAQLCVADQPVEEVITSRNVRPLGDWTEKHPDSADVQKAAQHAVETFNSRSKAKKIFKLVAINSAKVQVTNRITYEVNMILGKTKCLRSENHDLQSCSLDQKRLNCTFQVRFNVLKYKYQSRNKGCKKVVMTA